MCAHVHTPHICMPPVCLFKALLKVGIHKRGCKLVTRIIKCLKRWLGFKYQGHILDMFLHHEPLKAKTKSKKYLLKSSKCLISPVYSWKQEDIAKSTE